MPARIFVSYRRDDVAGDAGRLTDHLQRRFGKRRVFLDVDSIYPGIDFIQALDASMRETGAMLVVIGPRWASLRDADGNRRLDAPDDFVVREVEAALRRGIPVVPVLMQGASLPTAPELPASIASLATRQTAVIDHSEFHDDVERLCRQLATMVPDPAEKWWRWGPAAALAIALIAGFVAYRSYRTVDVDQRAPAAAAPAAAAPVESAKAPAPSVQSTGEPAGAPARGGKPRAPAQGTEPARALPADRVTVAATPGDLRREAEKVVLELQAAERSKKIDSLLAEAAAQRGRGQLTAAMATLASARELAPESETLRQTQEAQAVEWIRTVPFESELGRPAFAETATAALAVVDASLASATGTRRADLLAHSGWATYMLWRRASLTGSAGPAGSRPPDPLPRYREALAIEMENPFANAMLAHWAFRRDRDLPQAHRLFDTALRTRREVTFVRNLQWSTFGTDFQPRDDRELVRVADDMRRHGERLSMRQAETLYLPYLVATNPSTDDKQRQTLLDAVPPDDHIATIGWAFEGFAAARGDESTPWRIRFIVALLHEKAGRTDRAVADLRALIADLPKQSTMRQSVEGALSRLTAAAPRSRRN